MWDFFGGFHFHILKSRWQLWPLMNFSCVKTGLVLEAKEYSLSKPPLPRYSPSWFKMKKFHCAAISSYCTDNVHDFLSPCLKGIFFLETLSIYSRVDWLSKKNSLREGFKKKKVWNFPYFLKPTHPPPLVWKKNKKKTWSKNHFLAILRILAKKKFTIEKAQNT